MSLFEKLAEAQNYCIPHIYLPTHYSCAPSPNPQEYKNISAL